MLILIEWALKKRRGETSTWGRERIAIILVLLGSFTIAAKATTDEVLADPLVIERVVRAALVGMAGLAIAPTLLRNAKTSTRTRATGLAVLWLYVLVCALSTLYSVAPIVTGPKVIELAVGLAIVTSLFLSPNPAANLKRAISFIVTLDLGLVAAAVIGFFALPHVFASIQYRPGFLFSGTMGSPWASSNSLSAAGSVVAAYSLAKYFETTDRRRVGWILGFVVGTVATVLASGRQGVAMWVVAIGILLFIHRRRLFLLLLAPVIAGLIVLNWDFVLSVLSRNQSENSLLLLTGRIRFWLAAFSAISQHPWTGFGFGAGGRFVALSAIGEGSRSNLHNGYLEALTGVGIMGLIPLLLVVVIAARWSVRQLIRKVDTSIAILMVPLVLHTFVDLGFGAWLKPDFLILAAVVALADLGRNKATIESRENLAVRVGRDTEHR